MNQLNRGAGLITSREERERVAELNLIAGERAKTSTAYASALTYFAAGRALLTEDSWEQRYPLMFALEFHRAECEFLSSQLPAAEQRLAILAARTATLVDTAAVACLSLELYTTLDRSDRGVELCLGYLRRIGVQWSPHPTREEVRTEYEEIRRRIGDGSIEAVVDQPLMRDPEWSATLDVLAQVVTPALFTDDNLLCLVLCRMVNISLEHGNSGASCFAYVWLGMIVGPYFDDYPTAFRFGQLGLELVEQRGLDRFKARVYMSFGNLVNPWTKHVRTGRPLVRRAFNTANEMGDLTFAAYSCNNLITNLLASGEPLADIQREAEAGLAFARKIRFGLVIDIITSQLRLILTLRGLTPAFNSFNDAQFDEAPFEQHFEADPRLALPSCWYWIRKLQARFHAGDYVSAIYAELQAQRLLWTSPSFFEVAEYRFYAALARAAYWNTSSRRPASGAPGSSGRTSSATRDLGASLPRELRKPHGVGQRRNRAHRRSVPRRRASLRGGHPPGAASTGSSRTKASPASSPRGSTRRGASRPSPRRTCATPGTAICVGGPTARCGNWMRPTRTCGRSSHRHLRRPRSGPRSNTWISRPSSRSPKRSRARSFWKNWSIRSCELRSSTQERSAGC